MLESKVEERLRHGVEHMGGLCYKFVSPGNAGVPDRLIVMPGGRVLFVELKTDTGRLAKLQQWQRDRLTKRGASVWTLYGVDAVDVFLKGLMSDEI